LKTQSDSTPPPFLFGVCQHGAERVCKQEVLNRYPFLTFAFSRPGFLTFKVAPDQELPTSFEIKGTFVRTSGWSMGKIEGSDDAEWTAQLIPAIRKSGATAIHIWQRDSAMPGDRGFEPGNGPEVDRLIRSLRPALDATKQVEEGSPELVPTESDGVATINGRINQTAKRGERVFDVVLVDRGVCWTGWHTAFSIPRSWPGGVPPLDRSIPVISRAYWKLAEGLLWSRLPLKPGQCCVELGAAPGGACQLLLERGMRVIAVDPAELHPSVTANKNLVHLRSRARETRRIRLKPARWLFADLNVAPNYTLQSVEDIVRHPKIKIMGMLLTMKLLDWDLVDSIPKMVDTVRGWGFAEVRTRQLAFNRREFCLAAQRTKH
jgi:23S rRNA (cytidine2498-2'-O)-methyltransferase